MIADRERQAGLTVLPERHSIPQHFGRETFIGDDDFLRCERRACFGQLERECVSRHHIIDARGCACPRNVT